MAPIPTTVATRTRTIVARAAPAIALGIAAAASKHHKKGHPGWSDADEDQLIRDQWSSVVGWISIACWVIVYTPQLKENYDRKSGDGLSLAFVVIWLAGDFLNLIGAWRQELLWTMIILAGYYTLCDVALIAQYYYYRKHHDFYHPALPAPSSSSHSNNEQANESTPLIPGKPASSPTAAPRSLRMEILRYVFAALVVLLTGVAAWAVEQYGKGGQPDSRPPSKPEGPGWRWDAQVYGWLSAALYLASRVPQIFKNRQTKCEGLSLALFLFAVAGNVTYVASIVIKSTDQEYLTESASWLVGSLGTIVLDFIVLGQFVAYREERQAIVVAADTAERAG